MNPVPILLIHGFNGAPTNWTGPSDRFPEYLAEHGFDPELIRVFNYGYDEYDGRRRYNNLGDMRAIAHRLDITDGPDAHDCSVDRLSRESVARGGPAKVTIIAHSSGGLVARYYLSRPTEDEWGTRYRGNVGRVIFLGTPHRGVDVEDILDPLPTNLLLYRLMVRVHYLLPPEYHEHSESLRARFLDWQQVSKGVLKPSADDSTGPTPAFKQMHPNSPFLNDINQPGAMPTDIVYHNIIGDIRAHVCLDVWGRRLINAERSFGDMLVTTASAGAVPNASSSCYPIVDTYGLDADVGRRASHLVQLERGEGALPIHRHLRSLPAARQRMLEILVGSEVEGLRAGHRSGPRSMAGQGHKP